MDLSRRKCSVFKTFIVQNMNNLLKNAVNLDIILVFDKGKDLIDKRLTSLIVNCLNAFLIQISSVQMFL